MGSYFHVKNLRRCRFLEQIALAVATLVQIKLYLSLLISVVLEIALRAITVMFV